MEEKEDKGFVFKDSRKMNLDGPEEGTETKEAEGAQQVDKGEQGRAKEEFEEASQKNRAAGHTAFPEVTLSTFVFSLSSSALVHLGEIPEPETQSVSVDLPMAKQIIDTLGMLQQKTVGNLDQDEDRLLKSVLYDLRMRYIQKSGRQGSR